MVKLNENKKTIIIVEDDFNELKRVKNIIYRPMISIYPDTKEDWKEFKSAFRKALHPSDDSRDKKIQWIKNKFKEYNISAFVIDFLLNGNDTEIITGKKFFEYFVRNDYPQIKTMILTRLLENSKADITSLKIDQDLRKLKDEINNNHEIIFDYKSKIFNDNIFCEDLENFIHGTENTKLSEMENLINNIHEWQWVHSNVKEKTKGIFLKLISNINEQIEYYKNNSDILFELNKLSDPTENNLNEFINSIKKYIKG